MDSLGAGSLPDSFDYDDYDVNCLTNVSEFVDGLSLPYLSQLGFGNITFIKNVHRLHETEGFYGKIKPRSSGKDKLIAYWEMMGVSTNITPTIYTDDIPEEVLHQFSHISEQKFLNGKFGSSYSVIAKYFQEHLETKKPIIHAAPDGSIQIMAHEDIISPVDLYKLCFKIRKMCDRHKIMRLVAKPCSGAGKPKVLFNKEKVFPMPIPELGVLDALSVRNVDIYSVGKVSDYFNDIGFLDTYRTNNYLENLEKAIFLLLRREKGQQSREIIFVEYNNSYFDVDTGMDKVTSYASFLEGIESYIPVFKDGMYPDDVLVILGDQPSDQTKEGKISTREYVPILIFSKLFKPYNTGSLGVRKTFIDFAMTLAEMYGFQLPYAQGESFWQKISSQI